MQPQFLHRAKLVLSLLVLVSGLTVVLGERFQHTAGSFFSLLARTVFWVVVIAYFSLLLAGRAKSRK